MSIVSAPQERHPDRVFPKERDSKTAATLKAALSGDEMSGFEEIYRKYYRRVYSICLRMTGNVHEAEDLTQEVFVQLNRKLASFKGDSEFTTWLHRLTVNQVLMHFRKRSVKSEQTTEDGEMPEVVDPDTINPEAMPVVERIALEAAIAKLPPGYRRAFVLHDIQGYEHEEIAKITGWSSGTSKSQLHKARLKLRALLRLESKKLFVVTDRHGIEPAHDIQPVANSHIPASNGTVEAEVGMSESENSTGAVAVAVPILDIVSVPLATNGDHATESSSPRSDDDTITTAFDDLFTLLES